MVTKKATPKTRKSAIGIKRPVVEKSAQDRRAIVLRCLTMSGDCIQMAKAVENSKYKNARANQKALVKNIQQIRI